MATGKVHTGDTYTDFQLVVKKTETSGSNVAVDLSATSVRKFIFTDPSGSETEVTASIVNSPGSDGLLRYINSTPSPVISTAGLWKYRAKITMTTGGIFQSNEATFEVLG